MTITETFASMPGLPRYLSGNFALQDIAPETISRALTGPIPGDDRLPVSTGQFRGWMWIKDIQPGLSASVYDMTSVSDAVMARPVGRSIRIEILLHGGEGDFRPEGCEVAPARPGHAQVIGLGETHRCSRRLTAGERRSRVGILVKPDFFEHFPDALAAGELDQLARFMAPGVHSASLRRDEMLIRLARSIVDDPYSGSLGALFRESALVQILSRTLTLLGDQERIRDAIGSRHHEAVLRAQAVLDDALCSPPGTLELAREVGLNRNALQAGFKAAFGTSIFGYVRDQRLRMARTLIHEYHLGAAEAGYRVGFKSPSAFSAAYRRAFGQIPSEVPTPPLR